MLVLLAFATLMNSSVVEVPASRWRAIDLPVAQHGTSVEGNFEVIRGSKVQVILASREEAERLNRGRSFRPLFNSGFTKQGRFRITVREAGDYVLVIDNRIEGRFEAQVRLNVNLSNRVDLQARELPPARRQAVVTISLMLFGAIVAASAWQFLRHSAS